MSKLLQNTLDETLACLPAGGINELSALIDPAWIEQALAATGARALDLAASLGSVAAVVEQQEDDPAAATTEDVSAEAAIVAVKAA